MSPVLVPVAEIEVILGESVDVGITRDGHRRVTPILGGTVRGLPSAEDSVVEALRAEIRPGGGDRQLIRGSGDGLVVEIDATYDARTAEGALIGIRAQGVRTTSEAGVYFRVTIRFETADPALAGLQDALFIADGTRDADRVRHTVYRVG
ncbi:MAG TPA: DUF3237 domain-containing protein [Gordonia sp. (in: high G+C Gram-positive bacteria)]|uniref:DUF3237 domain-containing protein n=1 Tax=unclassified Gordonia (in: high G+C Gram-positive bacteria) TaxID=2657482 RepID=UPI000FA49EDC|nr:MULTISPECIES: DUF3237 domain-containing protein [unclassified Gordonia (in: high G+C Gram-positive bacteria)]RUP37245.1 MAG: DUF3237 domain-containing protein [Gordonia sp. (in: high G+C Gram-positive bacteria)]HNP56263.1 DUF3237 domain-containing protein [Gordonia sp. (in: high G+C Gram-positive bacteria)]HRC52083.1 DUF3237 domain-containing protein [Gordonia sp. (in: high G+C Gram-positive bacteria)]